MTKRILTYPLWALYVIYVATPLRMLGVNGGVGTGQLSYLLWSIKYRGQS